MLLKKVKVFEKTISLTEKKNNCLKIKTLDKAKLKSQTLSTLVKDIAASFLAAATC